jgi:hypothetical protein
MQAAWQLSRTFSSFYKANEAFPQPEPGSSSVFLYPQAERDLGDSPWSRITTKEMWTGAKKNFAVTLEKGKQLSRTVYTCTFVYDVDVSINKEK